MGQPFGFRRPGQRSRMPWNKDNVGSAKSIQNNGGVLENEIVVDGVVEQRYWIELA